MLIQLDTQLIDPFALHHFFRQGRDFSRRGQVQVLCVYRDYFLVVSLVGRSGKAALDLILFTPQFLDPCVEILFYL